MKTEAPSPKSRLLALWNRRAPARPGNSTTATTWLGLDFRCGDLVREKGSRHVARIDAILPTLEAKVTYLDSGWKAQLRLTDLEYDR
jgi:hypothetical protein